MLNTCGQERSPANSKQQERASGGSAESVNICANAALPTPLEGWGPTSGVKVLPTPVLTRQIFPPWQAVVIGATSLQGLEGWVVAAQGGREEEELDTMMSGSNKLSG